MSYVKHTQHEGVDAGSKMDSFADLCFEMNVQINMQDPETPPFNCHVAGNCVQNRPLVASEVSGLSVSVDLGFMQFQIFDVYETCLL